ncbi:recombinase family protein [Lysinibacillus piscis]|uniref:Serine recombinase n=1 Tax=Lysinibacillus piscis TaxID=2518931 RepID=A0ABQ5NK33_9BACI|nr:recombinase family protein [Lysinibacillus sp. KH24]GLC88649.1 serine recombinase [Lysinibacillus sp. KH24]
MRVIIYIRVSTKLQEQKFSLAGQESELTKYAESQGWIIVNIYQDVDSGGKLDKAGLNALLDDVEEGKVDVVLVADQDRLSRLDTVEWEYLKDILRTNNVKIAEPGRITDLSNEDDVFYSDLKNLIAQREKKTIVRRMMRGKKQRMREGKGFGMAPLGYKFDKTTKKYVLDEEWNWVIPFIDKLYLEEQLGMMAIANRLNEISRTPSGRFWNEKLISDRLTSKAFHGVMEKRFSTGEIIVIEDAYPPLRTKETYDLIQLEREKRGTIYKVTSRAKLDLHYLRRTTFTCGLCGRKILLVQHGTAKTPRYYLKHGRKLKIADRSVCDISINTIRFDKNISKLFTEILDSESLASKYFQFENNEQKIEQLKESIESLSKAIHKNEIKLDRLLELYLDGEFDKSTLVKRQTKIKEENESLTNEHTQLSKKLKLMQNNEFNYELIYDLFSSLKNFEIDYTPGERAKIFGHLFPKGILYPDELILISEISGVPLEIGVVIDKDPYPGHASKKV